jgi:hypothetical protein
MSFHIFMVRCFSSHICIEFFSIVASICSLDVGAKNCDPILYLRCSENAKFTLITRMFVIAFAVILPHVICCLLLHPNSLNYHHSSQRYDVNNYLGPKDLKNRCELLY